MTTDEDLIEDVDVDALLAESEAALEEAKKLKKEEDGCDDNSTDDEEEMDEAAKVDGKDNDDKEDDGKGLDKVGDEDSDVDNDGDSDKSDEFLTKRRKAIEKSKNESVNFVADMTSLAEADESLSEEFKEKAGTLFEVALTTRLREETERLQEEFDDRLNEETTKMRSSLEEKVDNYLTYAVESWVEDNKIAIESGLRAEVAESFIDALKNVFVEHYIEVPESKKDLVSELETKLNIAEEALSATGKQAEELTEQVETLVREKILAEAAESLADTQGARLQALAQDIEFVNEETFRKKVATIKECYFKGKTEVIEEEAPTSYQTTEVIVEEADASDLSPTMQNYVKALGRINKASSLSGR